MSSIHYFQRYSTKENSVTNNTLLLFSRLYNKSAIKFELFLAGILDYQVDVGPDFNQQVRAISSIPDAIIHQNSFKIIIETKVDAGFRKEQVLNHAKGFGDEKRKILLLISKYKLSKEEFKDIIDNLGSHSGGISFANIDFESIGKIFRSVLSDFDYDLEEIAEDWESYCKDEKLIENSKYFMKVVPCGSSFDINLKHGIYFHPSDRAYSDHNFIGIYRKKSVRAIGEVECVVDATLINGEASFVVVRGELSQEKKASVLDIISDAAIQTGYDITSGHRFFCVKRFFETDFTKETSGGLWGARYFDLSKLITNIEKLNIQEVAERLKYLKWQ